MLKDGSTLISSRYHSSPLRRSRGIRNSTALLVLYSVLQLLLLPGTIATSLYKEGDNILELDVDTFNSTVYNKPHAYFVEFYSAWCGHCIDYAPHYVKFATLLKTWKDVVVVSAVNCAEEKNAPVCREHEIDAFPTLRYFKVWSKDKSASMKFEGDKKNMEALSSKVASWIKEDYNRDRPLNWPRYEITPLQMSLSDIWASTPMQTQLLCVVVEDEPANNGFAMLSNYASDKRVHVSIVSPSHPVAGRFGTAPSVMLFKRLAPEQVAYSSSGDATTWIAVKEQVDKLLEELPSSELHVNGVGQPQAHHGSITDETSVVSWNQFELQYLDLTTAMHYMLYMEVPRKPLIIDEHYSALRNWVHVLRKYGPGATPVRRLFYRLDEFLSGATSVSAERWLGKLEEIQSELGHPLPANTTYMSCRGSKPYLRGYTCGLWTLAHTVTVEAYNQEKSNSGFDPLQQVLEPFHQFIVQFLSCEVCAKNFNDLTQGNQLSGLKRPEDVVLWLWRAHNNVNKRLSGEKSDDPLFPKQQFPPARLCPQCRLADGATFDEQRVLEFTLKYYTDIKTDGDKPSANYQVKEFVNGKLVKVSDRRLNPKFSPMAGKVDELELAESGRMRQDNAGGAKRQWKKIDGDGYESSVPDRSADRSTFYLLWLAIVALVLLLAYYKYRQNRSKFWKSFYTTYHNIDYRVFPWQQDSVSNLHKYRV